MGGLEEAEEKREFKLKIMKKCAYLTRNNDNIFS